MDSAFSLGVDPNVCMVLRTGGIQNCSKKAWLYMNFIRSGSTSKELNWHNVTANLLHSTGSMDCYCYIIDIYLSHYVEQC